MLTEKEQKEIDELPLGFNIVKENENYENLSFRRVLVSKEWAGKLLKISAVLNFLSVAFFVLALIFSLLKPSPDYYASTPSGKVYGPLKKLHLK